MDDTPGAMGGRSDGLSQDVIEDLARSGLKPQDVAARPLTGVEYAATGQVSTSRIPSGYVIPYFNLLGEGVGYYRIKVLDTHATVKYRAIQGQQNHVYFPRGLRRLLVATPTPNYLLITEGEKKAACAVAQGFPAIGFSGVDNWRNRHIIMPDNTELKQNKAKGIITAKIPRGDSNTMVIEDTGVMAAGFLDLVHLLVSRSMEAIIVYDTDKHGVKMEVQRAAAQLGYELRYRGLPISKIRQLVLSQNTAMDKVGLDDYLMAKGIKEFAKLLRICRAKRIAFPQHPNPKVFVAAKLQKSRLTRKETQEVALSILMELETRGRRLRNVATQEAFFFDEETHTLMAVHLGSTKIMLHDTSFGAYLYQQFNLAAIDQRVIGWLAAQYNGEPGIEEARTHKVLARPDKKPHCIAYQLSDSHFVVVTPDPNKPFLICENGQHGVLFEQDQVEPISHTMLEGELADKLEALDEKSEPLWKQVIEGFNFNPVAMSTDDLELNPMSMQENRDMAMLLYYLSPWFYKWQGMQLPVEIVIGEPGSGKSSMYELRQMIITGKPRLSNMTNDIKDWYAAITSQGGLHVMDNVHFTGQGKDYAQRLSDEMCRLVTEPQPHVELRKLYTTSDVISLPVNTTFAITAVEQPFFRPDLIQRSAIFELQALQGGHDARWVRRQLERSGGRTGWIAHHLAVIHRFLRLAVHDRAWDPNYRAHHRLANYEQAMVLMARTLGIASDWIPKVLLRSTALKEAEADWTLAGIEEFIKWWKTCYKEWDQKKFASADIVEWAEDHEVYGKNPVLTNSWKLGKYIRSHRGSMQRRLNVHEDGKKMNKIMYRIRK